MYEVKISVDKGNYAYALERALENAGWVQTGAASNPVSGCREIWMIPPEDCHEAVPEKISVNAPNIK